MLVDTGEEEAAETPGCGLQLHGQCLRVPGGLTVVSTWPG